MNKKTIVIAALLATATATTTFAADSAVTGAAGGAVTGAVVGGPVGAAVGGVVGAIAGVAIDPPPQKVITYVETQPAPPQPVVIQQPVVVGKPIPQTVVLTPVPEDPTYSYAFVNDQRVIVDPNTYVVVGVY
ncbi:DUF1236 domain-containing protein [Rhizobium sp. PAMB 3182]